MSEHSAENGLPVKRMIVVGLEALCGVLDRIPRYEGRRWYRHGCWGCYPLNLAGRAAELDERWGTGIWRVIPPGGDPTTDHGVYRCECETDAHEKPHTRVFPPGKEET